MAESWNLALIQEALAGAFAGREAIVFGRRRLSWQQYVSRGRRLANYLRSRGLGEVRDRAALEPWQSGQDHVALYLYNGNEYLEGMFGAYRGRMAPFNVNYRYVGEELEYLLNDAGARAIVYHARLAPTLAAIRKNLPALEVLLQVSDGSGEPLLEGAADYEEALASASDDPPDCTPSPDDLYILYTGGTTGMPKGVLWRQEDIFFAAMGGTLPMGQRIASLDQLLSIAKNMGPLMRGLPLPPFMHGAAHWYAHMLLHTGGTVFIAETPDRLDPDEIWSLVGREKLTSLLIVGDAFAVPLLDQLKNKSYDLKSLRGIGSGGAILSPHYKGQFLELVPHLMITDGLGSSESGAQGALLTTKAKQGRAQFRLGKGSTVLSEDLSRVLEPGSGESGWLARTGHIPLGYLGDREKTNKTFPTIDGVRYSVPGDHATFDAKGVITLLGRGSVCINTGGEKVYPEEVEKVLKSHPGVYDAVVVGTPHPKWVQQVTAVLVGRQGKRLSREDLTAHCQGRLAGYKIPKDLIWVEEMVRSPSGKADYRWARQTAERALGIEG